MVDYCTDIFSLRVLYEMVTGQAIVSLERSIAAGKTDVEWWRQDGDLDNIRNDPRFQELVERMEARAAQQTATDPS